MRKMKPFPIVGLILAAMFTSLLILPGCEDETVVNPPVEPERFHLTIAGLPDSLTAPEGYTRQLAFVVIVQNAQGQAAVGETVELSVSFGPGTVSTGRVTTGSDGTAQAVYTVQMPSGSASAQILAAVQGDVATAAISLFGTGVPAWVGFTADPQVITLIEPEDTEIVLTAVVTDSDGLGIPGVAPRFRLSPAAEGDSIFGSLSRPGLTDRHGQVEVTFNTRGGWGQVKVGCEVLDASGENVLVSADLTMEVRLVSSQIESITVEANPDRLVVPPGSLGESVVTVQVRDRDHNGIPFLQIRFQSDLGIISTPALTDSMGAAVARFNNNYEYGEATITASVPGTEWWAETTIQVESPYDTEFRLYLYTDRHTIYADNGQTKANLTAVLKDDDNQALAGRELIFTATHGSVNSPVTTDSMGIVRVEFIDIGIPSVDPQGNPEPAVIIITYRLGGVVMAQASVEVMILERNRVSTIFLTAAAAQMRAGSNDSISVRATCILENTDRAPDGTMVHFRAQLGYFRPEDVPISGGFGVAESRYFPGNAVGTDILFAFVVNPEGDTVRSNEVTIKLLPGPPNNVRVWANPTQIRTNDPSAFSTITATLSDSSNNPIAEEGILVTFTTTLGTINPPTVTTDEDGDAHAILTPGVEAGIAMVTATVQGPAGPIEGHTTVRFISGQPNSIDLSADPLLLQVVGTGGISTSTISATVRDANGNLMTATPVTVVFELINEPPEPEGCNINNRGQIDSSNTSNGVAVVSLNSGTQIGGKLIRAYTWRDVETRQDTVQAVLSTVAVVGGPPYHLDIDMDNEGEDAGGGVWVVEGSVRVWDIYRNPAADSIVVLLTVDPEIATIEPGYTSSGRALFRLYYHSINTFDTLTILAEIQTPGGVITGSREYVLPLQWGELSLYADPANWMFPNGGEGHGPLARIRCWVVLRDGHSVPINNGPVLFTTTRARFYWFNWSRHQDKEFFPEPAVKYTGWRPPMHVEHNDEDGQATVFLKGEEPDFFLDPFTLEVPVQINARVVGYDGVFSEPVFVIMNRH